MARKPTHILFVMLGGLTLFFLGAGLIHLFILRFEIGDIYDPYSSLRADPLGTKAYYESLEISKLYTVSRNYQSLLEFTPTNQTTLFSWGIAPSQMPGYKDRALQLYTFLRKGGRLVVGYTPQSWATTSFLREEEDTTNEVTEASSEVTNETSTCSLEEGCTNTYRPSIEKWWGARIAYAPMSNDMAILNPTYTNTSLPREISCHTSMIFTNIDESWSVVYSREDHPVIIERRLGDGSLVLSALSYYLSNEALRGERHTALLTWLPGTSPRVVFDESLHHVIAARGLAQLIRGYRLHFFLGMLALLVVLFIWQRSVSLVPPVSPTREESGISTAHGRDSLSGLVNLLRRNISQKKLLDVCIDEWDKSAQSSSLDHQAISSKLKQLLQAGNNPRGTKMTIADRYNHMQTRIEEYKKKRPTGKTTS